MKPITILLLAVLSISAASAQTKKYQVATGISAQISHAPNTATVEVAMPGVELISLDLAQPVAPTYLIKTNDYNFDGYKDFALVAVNQATGNQLYDIYLYHPADKTFETLEVPGGVCDRFGNVRISAGDKTLRSSCRAVSKSSMDIFKYTDPFSLELVKSTDNSRETLQEVAEEKAEKKADKSDVRKEKREELQDRKKEKKEEREDDDN